VTERLREKKREFEPKETLYDMSGRVFGDIVKRREEGKVVIKYDDVAFEQNRQGFIKFLQHRPDWDKVGAPGWYIFINRIHKQSGKHIHQGGLVILVLDGEGYTVVDGERYDWEEGDLIVLPIKPGGVEHQHFNKDPNRPADWIAFDYRVMREIINSARNQVEEHPDWVKPK